MVYCILLVASAIERDADAPARCPNTVRLINQFIYAVRAVLAGLSDVPTGSTSISVSLAADANLTQSSAGRSECARNLLNDASGRRFQLHCQHGRV